MVNVENLAVPLGLFIAALSSVAGLAWRLSSLISDSRSLAETVKRNARRIEKLEALEERVARIEEVDRAQGARIEKHSRQIDTIAAAARDNRVKY